jgi:sterol desaturase/sphingolipid hydroxylase (fatty acid hydroxylase superfamily)
MSNMFRTYVNLGIILNCFLKTLTFISKKKPALFLKLSKRHMYRLHVSLYFYQKFEILIFPAYRGVICIFNHLNFAKKEPALNLSYLERHL